MFVEDQIAIFLIGNQDMAVSCIFCEGERCRIDRSVDSSLAVQTGAAASSIDIQLQRAAAIWSVVLAFGVEFRMDLAEDGLHVYIRVAPSACNRGLAGEIDAVFAFIAR